MNELSKKLYNHIDGKSFNDFNGESKTWSRYIISCASCKEKREIMSTKQPTSQDLNFCNKCLDR